MGLPPNMPRKERSVTQFALKGRKICCKEGAEMPIIGPTPDWQYALLGGVSRLALHNSLGDAQLGRAAARVDRQFILGSGNGLFGEDFKRR